MGAWTGVHKIRTPESLSAASSEAEKDRIVIVNDKLVGMNIVENLSELLRRPFGGRMSGDITMLYSSRSDLHRHEDVQKSYLYDPVPMA